MQVIEVKVLDDGTSMLAPFALPDDPSAWARSASRIERLRNDIRNSVTVIDQQTGDLAIDGSTFLHADERGQARALLLPAGLPEVAPAYVALVTRQRPDVTYIPRRTDVVTPRNAVRGPNSALSTGRAVAA